MKLILLHGPPATGKFTVGRELAGRTGFAIDTEVASPVDAAGLIVRLVVP